MTLEDACEVRKLYRELTPNGKRKHTQKELASRFSVSQNAISKILMNKMHRVKRIAA